jgi:hypothetical protein
MLLFVNSIMPTKEEKRRRAKLVEAIVQKETAKAIEMMPISFSELGALFDYLDARLGEEGCDHTARMTRTFLQKKNLEPETILPWLQESGGYCDCEVLANVEESWGDEIEKNT